MKKKQTVLKTLSNYFPVLVISEFNIYTSARSFLPLDLPVVQGISQMIPPHTFKKNKKENKNLAKLNKQKRLKLNIVSKKHHYWLLNRTSTAGWESRGMHRANTALVSQVVSLQALVCLGNYFSCSLSQGTRTIRVYQGREIPRGPQKLKNISLKKTQQFISLLD